MSLLTRNLRSWGNIYPLHLKFKKSTFFYFSFILGIKCNNYPKKRMLELAPFRKVLLMTNNHSRGSNTFFVCLPASMCVFQFKNYKSPEINENMLWTNGREEAANSIRIQCSTGYLNSPQCANHLLSVLYDLQCCYLKLNFYTGFYKHDSKFLKPGFVAKCESICFSIYSMYRYIKVKFIHLNLIFS